MVQGLKLNANPNKAHRWLHCTHSQGANLNIGKINWYTVSFQSNVPNEISALFPWLFPIRSRTFHPKAVQERLVVQAPAQPGTTKVLRGRGPPRCDASGRGNLVLHFLLHLPRTLSPDRPLGADVETLKRKAEKQMVQLRLHVPSKGFNVLAALVNSCQQCHRTYRFV